MKLQHSVAIHSEHIPVPAKQVNTGEKLRILSFNIQTGISTEKYHHYLTKAWKHVLPHPKRFRNLDRIAELVRDYDLVGLQEVDAGSLRCGFINLTEYVARRSDFPFWYDQTNRKLGGVAKHAIGMLSRFQCSEIIEHRLPGPIPGRGALSMRFGQGEDALLVMIIHLALGKRARLQQLDYIAEQMSDTKHVILMGDMNFHSESDEMEFLIERTLMKEPIHGLHTWPSWRPRKSIDHILVSPTVQVDHVRVLDFPVSDHLPISMEVTLPQSVVIR